MQMDQGNTHQAGAILVAHLDPNMRSLLKEMFELEGYKVHATSDGPEAVRILREHTQGMIVFLEPLLLRVQGREGLQDLITSRGPQDRHVVIVLASQHLAEVAMRKLRADGCLPLPFNVDQLLAVVEDAQRIWRFKQQWPPTD